MKQTKNKKKDGFPEAQTGYAVVGTWISPRNVLGSALPMFISKDEREALRLGETNERIMTILNEADAYLCEITVKPLRKVIVESVKKLK